MKAWLWAVRDSARVAFLFRLANLAVNTVAFLIWNRILLVLLGAETLGLFLAFQAFLTLGGVGNLGLGGAVALRAGQYLGSGQEAELKEFLAQSRALFLVLAGSVLLVGVALSSFLPSWLGFNVTVASGSLEPLFALGAVSMALALVSNYVENLNYAVKTLTWPLIPSLVVPQFVLLGHVLLAWSGWPLWVQFVPYVAGAVVGLGISWTFLRWAQPGLSGLVPLHWSGRMLREVMVSSWWVYLCGLASIVFVSSARLIINGVMGSGQVPFYQFNFRIAEIALGLVYALSFVGVPRLTMLLAGDEGAVATAGNLLWKLQRVQAAVAIGLGFGYVMVNGPFMALWLGPEFVAPMSLVVPFTFYLVLAGSGDAAVQTAGRIGKAGIRVAGTVILAGALVQALGAYVAARAGSLTGVAWSMAVAQGLITAVLGFYVCRKIGLAWLRWLGCSLLLPGVAAVAALGIWALQPGGGFAAVASLVVVWLLFCRLLGWTFEEVGAEIATVRKQLVGKV